MEHYHPIGKPFNVTFLDGKKVRLVAREAATHTDRILQQEFRKTGCRGCYFCKMKEGYCSGHPYWTETCTEGGCEAAKCTPEYRLDGKFIHYKWIDTDKQPNK